MFSNEPVELPIDLETVKHSVPSNKAQCNNTTSTKSIESERFLNRSLRREKNYQPNNFQKLFITTFLGCDVFCPGDKNYDDNCGSGIFPMFAVFAFYIFCSTLVYLILLQSLCMSGDPMYQEGSPFPFYPMF